MNLVKIYAGNGQSFGKVVLLPSGFDPTKKYKTIIFLHGTGGAGKPTVSDLDRFAASGEIPGGLRSIVDSRQYVVIAPQTQYPWNMGEVEETLRVGRERGYITDESRKYLTGLSWGAGGTIYFIKQSLANANEFAAAAAAATTRQYSGNAKNIADAELPLLLVHNIGDPNSGTPMIASTEVYNDILKYNPKIKPTVIYPDAKVHDSWSLMYRDAPACCCRPFSKLPFTTFITCRQTTI